MRADQVIVLVGLMGCGKSTVGRLLARKLQWRFIDLDLLVAQAMGMSVAKIFENYGEDFFRDIESVALNIVLKKRAVVLAAGGGVVERAENRVGLRRQAQTVYLRLSPLAAAKRLGKAATASRPLLRGLDTAHALRELLRRRRIFYERARWQVSASDKPGKVVERILKKLHQ